MGWGGAHDPMRVATVLVPAVATGMAAAVAVVVSVWVSLSFMALFLPLVVVVVFDCQPAAVFCLWVTLSCPCHPLRPLPSVLLSFLVFPGLVVVVGVGAS